MRVYLNSHFIRKTLRWLEFGLFLIGSLLILYCAFVLFESYRFQHAQSLGLDRRRSVGSSPAQATLLVQLENKDSNGWRLEIERLGLSVMVGEGTNEHQLGLGAGHVSGTSMPGKAGNTAVSAHRDTYFRPLRNIKTDDMIVVTTNEAKFRYKVSSIRLVPPTDLSVLMPHQGETLTLITCYPFYFIGAAPKRFIVLAERII